MIVFYIAISLIVLMILYFIVFIVLQHILHTEEHSYIMLRREITKAQLEEMGFTKNYFK